MNSPTDIQREAAGRRRLSLGQRFLAQRKRQMLAEALGDLAPVFDHFGIKVTRREGDGWVLKGREHAIAISDDGVVESAREQVQAR